jgi:hypothetical protein
VNGSHLGTPEHRRPAAVASTKVGALRRCVADAGGTARVGRYFPQVTERPAAIDLSEPPVAETV